MALDSTWSRGVILLSSTAQRIAMTHGLSMSDSAAARIIELVYLQHRSGLGFLGSVAQCREKTWWRSKCTLRLTPQVMSTACHQNSSLSSIQSVTDGTPPSLLPCSTSFCTKSPSKVHDVRDKTAVRSVTRSQPKRIVQLVEQLSSGQNVDIYVIL